MLTLIGLPGCGKTAIGKRLAELMNVPFHDVDTAIERHLGCTISQYFAEHGEVRFRDIESEIINILSASTEGVLSTGGGSVLRAINRQRLKERGHVVYLNASPQALFKRLQHDTKRPLLQVSDKLARLTELYEFRDPLYRETAHTIMDSAGSRAATVRALALRLNLPIPSALGQIAPTFAYPKG